MKTINTDQAPKAIGPFVQGVISNNLLYVSGQGPVDPKTNEIVGSDIKTQTKQTLANLAAVIKAAGSNMNKVVRANVYLTNMNDYKGMNEVYANTWKDHRFARTCVEVSRLPIDILVEIDLIVEL